MYEGMNKRGTKPEKGLHTELIAQESVSTNLRVISVFDQSKIAKPYVMLMELLLTILLQTLPLDTTGSHRNQSTIEMIRKAKDPRSTGCPLEAPKRSCTMCSGTLVSTPQVS